MDKKNDFVFLWALAAVAPLLMIGGSFFIDQWTWGLMDDMSLLSQSGWWGKRCFDLFQGFLTWGTCRWTYAAYAATFYPIFENAPKFFYIFKMLIVVGTLLIWGKNAQMLTQCRTALFLLPVVALSYYFFYDSFSYLSIQEPLGLFFSGLAIFCFIKGCILTAVEVKPLRLGMILGGVVFMVLGVCSKEVFLSVPLAFGAALMLWAFHYRRKDMGIFAGMLIFVAIGYAVFLKFFFQHGYSSSYDLRNWNKISTNLIVWLKCSVVYHLPWLVLMLVGGIAQWRKRAAISLGQPAVFGVIASVFMYGLFLVLLLPWSVNSFYAIPLGILFAFAAVVVLAEFLETAPAWVTRGVVFLMLGFNIIVCAQAFGNMVAYRNDTAQLLDWVQYNKQFHLDLDQGFGLATNATEAGVAIPALLEKERRIKIPVFSAMPKVRDIVYDQKVIYYLYCVSYGDQDLRLINEMWSVVFSSKTWILFRRNYWLNH